MSDYPYSYVPFPFNVTPASPLFQLYPISPNISQGWVPSCFTPDCIPTASWSTGSIGAALSFQFWGWDVAFDGKVKGNMSVELRRNEVRQIWNPSADTLFKLHGLPANQSNRHKITLRVLNASQDSVLTVHRARVNGSTLVNHDSDADRWTILSNDTRLVYTGFSRREGPALGGTQATYTSLRVCDTMSLQFNASSFLMYGPCGPTSGLIKATINGRESITNTSLAIPSNDCLLFQSWGLPQTAMNRLEVENVDGTALDIDRFEFWWLPAHSYASPNKAARVIVIVFGSIFGLLLVWSGFMVMLKSSKKAGKVWQKLITLLS